MRYRNQSEAGDYVFGKRAPQFLQDSPQCVALAIKTRLLLWQGEWFLDSSEGTPFQQRILGYVAAPADRDLAIKERILGTQGVQGIIRYQSEYDASDRSLTVSVLAQTIYGPIAIVVPFPDKPLEEPDVTPPTEAGTPLFYDGTWSFDGTQSYSGVKV
jgi:hypothetical protein